MYIQIIREESDTQQDEKRISDLKKAIRAVAPEVRIEVRKSGEKQRLRVRCFGEFEVFDPEKPIAFRRARTKELFAVLVCQRGSMLSMGALLSILWENGEDSDSDRSYLRNLITDLKKTLAAVGADDVIIKKYNSIGIDASRLECDYYDFLEGKPEAVLSYNGQFMKQYSWAEYELRRT